MQAHDTPSAGPGFLKNLLLATAVIMSFGVVFGALTLKAEQAPAPQASLR